MFQAGSRQAPGYVPGRIKSVFFRVCSRQNEVRFFRLCSRQDQGRFQLMFQAGSRQVPVNVQGRIKAGSSLCSKQDQGLFRAYSRLVEAYPRLVGAYSRLAGAYPRGGRTLFQADSHASSGKHTVPKCVHVQYCKDMYLPNSRLYSVFVFLDPTLEERRRDINSQREMKSKRECIESVLV